MKPAPKVGDWVRMDNSIEHRVARRWRNPVGQGLSAACGMSLVGPVLAVMPAPTSKACPVCRKMSEQA